MRTLIDIVCGEGMKKHSCINADGGTLGMPCLCYYYLSTLASLQYVISTLTMLSSISPRQCFFCNKRKKEVDYL